jgi:hypothetical protein
MVSFTPLPLYRWGRSLCTHWRGGWVNLRTGLDDAENKKFLILQFLEI